MLRHFLLLLGRGEMPLYLHPPPERREPSLAVNETTPSTHFVTEWEWGGLELDLNVKCKTPPFLTTFSVNSDRFVVII